MKKYNINPEEREFSWGEMDVVVLGERGRGRFESLIPFQAKEEAEFLAVGKTKTDKPKIIESVETDGWLAVVSGSGSYTRGTYGTVHASYLQEDKVEVISSGQGAFGMAGRIGEYNEFLLKVKEDTFLYVRPAGGRNKSDRYWLYFGEQKVFEIKENELEIFCEQNNVDVPDIGIDLIEHASASKQGKEK